MDHGENFGLVGQAGRSFQPLTTAIFERASVEQLLLLRFIDSHSRKLAAYRRRYE